MRDLEQHLFDIIEEISDFRLTIRKEQVKQCQISPLTECQERYLRVIDKYNPLTSGEFAELICVSKPTATQIINRFVNFGYVTKEVCPSDKRSVYIRMTEQGKRAARIDQVVTVKTIQYIQTNLNEDELVQLVDLLDKLVK